MKTALVLTAAALTASLFLYWTAGIWDSFWLGILTGMAVGAYHAYKLYRAFGHTECWSLDETAAYASKLAFNYIGTGALLVIPFAVLWHVPMDALLTLTVWKYATALSYVGTGYIAAGFLLLAFSFFSYMSLYGNCNGHKS